MSECKDSKTTGNCLIYCNISVNKPKKKIHAKSYQQGVEKKIIIIRCRCVGFFVTLNAIFKSSVLRPRNRHQTVRKNEQREINL